MTREEAIAKLVALDVATWGRDALERSERLRNRLSHGQALMTLATYDVDSVDEWLEAEATEILAREGAREPSDEDPPA